MKRLQLLGFIVGAVVWTAPIFSRVCEFKLSPLPYEYDALEPYISKDIMQLHYESHYKGYLSKLNALLKETSECAVSVEELLKRLDTIPGSIRTAVVNNAGGVANHTLFWKSMSPTGKRKPGGKMLRALKDKWGTWEKFKDEFTRAAKGVFGSGWVWVCADAQGMLSIVTTTNQDSPLSQGLIPLLNLDVWEHAYYLQYFSKRDAYIDAWWQVVDWTAAQNLYSSIGTKQTLE